MIRTEIEYQNSLERVEQMDRMLKDQEKKLAAEGLLPEQIKRVLDPSQVLREQINEELEIYRRLWGFASRMLVIHPPPADDN
jgi:hypothetical protein